jgi:hypothetical protein
MHRGTQWAAATVGAGLLALAAACGGSADASPSKVVHHESDVVKYLGLSGNDNDGWVYYDNSYACDVIVILTTKEAVQLYVNAGDNIVTNPGGNVGLKLDSTQVQRCGQALTQALSGLKP